MQKGVKFLLSLLLLLLLPSLAYAQLTFPKYDGFVNDFENILNNDDALEAKLAQLEKDTTAEVVVVTVSDFQETTIEDYAVKLFENWRIGKEDVDNGLLIVVSSNERQSRIEVGYGLEGTLPDALTGRIQDEYMIPSFAQGDYSKGIEDGVDVIAGLIKEDPTIISQLQQKDSGINDGIISLFMMLFFFAMYIMGASKSWWLGGVLGFVAGAYFAYTSNLWLLPFLTTPFGLILDYILSKTTIGQAIVHNTFRSSGRSGSSGGGFSFGGGSSGGGGSSRSW